MMHEKPIIVRAAAHNCHATNAPDTIGQRTINQYLNYSGALSLAGLMSLQRKKEK